MGEKYRMRGLNSRPLACEASVIATTPTRPEFKFLVRLFICGEEQDNGLGIEWTALKPLNPRMVIQKCNEEKEDKLNWTKDQLRKK